LRKDNTDTTWSLDRGIGILKVYYQIKSELMNEGKTITVTPWRIPVIFFVFILRISISACTSDDDANADIQVLRVDLLPDEKEMKLLARYVPPFDYISELTNIPYELFIPESYDDLLELFHEGKIHMERFGSYTFVKNWRMDNAVAMTSQDNDLQFSIFGTHDHPGQSRLKPSRTGPATVNFPWLIPPYRILPKGI